MSTSVGKTTELQALLDKAGEADPSVYDELIAQASDRLLKLTRKMLRGYPHLRRWEQTDDVFQGAAMRLHRSLAAVQPESVPQFFGLAATQIRRTLIDLARHHFGAEGPAAHHESHGGRDEHGGIVENAAQPGHNTDSLEAWAAFHEAVEQLPSDERDVVQLLWYSGLSQQDAAQLLEVSVPTLQRRWYRARHRIHAALAGEQPPVDES